MKCSIISGIDPHDLQTIYNDTQPSITRNTHNTSDETVYYAKMSEIEFCLLLDKNVTDALLGNLLEMDTPSVTYVERTLRMMKFFVRALDQFSMVETDDIDARFGEVIGVLEEYAAGHSSQEKSY